MKGKNFLLLTTAVLLIIANTVENGILLRVALFLNAGAIICSIIKDAKDMTALRSHKRRTTR